MARTVSHDTRSFFFSSRRRHTRCSRDWSSDVCSSDLRRHVVVVIPATRRRTCTRVVDFADLHRHTRADRDLDVHEPRIRARRDRVAAGDRKSTRLNSSHGYISYAVFCLKKKKKNNMYRIDVLEAAWSHAATRPGSDH